MSNHQTLYFLRFFGRIVIFLASVCWNLVRRFLFFKLSVLLQKKKTYGHWSLLSLKTEKNHILLLAYEELQEKEEAKKIPRDTVHSYWFACQDCVEVSVPSWGCTVRCTPSRHRPGSASCAPAPPSPRPRSHCRTQARSAVFIRSFTHSLDGGSLTLPSLLPCMESNPVSKLINIFNRMLMRRKTKPIFSDMKIDNSMEGIFAATKLAQVKLFLDHKVLKILVFSSRYL